MTLLLVTFLTFVYWLIIFIAVKASFMPTVGSE